MNETRDNLLVRRQSQVQLLYRCVNKSGEEIPPYATMYVKEPPTRDDNRGPWVYDAFKPDAECEKSQDVTTLMFNGPRPIAAGSGATADKKRGWGTFSLPVTAQVDSAAPAGEWVGPKRDQWYLQRGGLTHHVKQVVTVSGTTLASLGPVFNPGGFIRFIDVINSKKFGDVKILRFDTTSEDYVDTGLELNVLNPSPGTSSGLNKDGQVKSIQGIWSIDVDYC